MRSLIGHWINALGLAALGFAVWTGFALFNGSGRIREAWDTGAYWTFGVPILLLALFAAGAASEPGSGRAAWQLALYAALGHALAAALVVPAGTDFGLLPLTLALVGLPIFVAFFVAAVLGRLLGRLWR
jgi:hypothetical protein